jgi:hypothetical protein
MKDREDAIKQREANQKKIAELTAREKEKQTESAKA